MPDTDPEESPDYLAFVRDSSLLPAIAQLVALPPTLPGRSWNGAAVILFAGNEDEFAGNTQIVKEFDWKFTERQMVEYMIARMLQRLNELRS